MVTIKTAWYCRVLLSTLMSLRNKILKTDYTPGGTPLYKPCRYVPPKRVWFLRRFGLKTALDFAHFGGGVFEEITGVYERI